VFESQADFEAFRNLRPPDIISAHSVAVAGSWLQVAPEVIEQSAARRHIDIAEPGCGPRCDHLRGQQRRRA
jgi:hypothetical protein